MDKKEKYIVVYTVLIDGAYNGNYDKDVAFIFSAPDVEFARKYAQEYCSQVGVRVQNCDFVKDQVLFRINGHILEEVDIKDEKTAMFRILAHKEKEYDYWAYSKRMDALGFKKVNPNFLRDFKLLNE